MAQTNAGFALHTLASWCVLHGINSVRDALAAGAEIAATAESSEQLARALEQAATAADAGIPQAKASAPHPAAPAAEDPPKRRSGRRTGEASGEGQP